MVAEGCFHARFLRMSAQPGSRRLGSVWAALARVFRVLALAVVAWGAAGDCAGQADGSGLPAELAGAAAAREVYGDGAPAAYAKLAGALSKGSPERLDALRRGFRLALRDADLKQAASFAGELEAAGHPEFQPMLGGHRGPGEDSLVPGGLEAFAAIAHVRAGTPRERLFAEYARQVVSSVCRNCMGDHYTALVQGYFATITQLEGLGTRDGNRVAITLSLAGKEERSRTENVLRLLGLQMRTEKGKLRLDRGEKTSENKRQDILAALNFDEVGAQEALQAGKPFVFEMKDELAEVYPSAKMWRESFPRLEQKQFALALLREPLVARLYLGVSMLDRRTVQALIANSSLYYFTGRTADLLAIYGTSFAVEPTRASVPGGVAAGPVWKEMVGVGPERAGAFYQALLDQKTTTLAAYFFALSQLDAEHQAFFTANVARMERFYGVYATLPEAQGFAPANVAKDSPFRALLRSVPIGGKGHVAFPGSVAVWARGGGADEDEVLLRMVETRVRSRDGGLTALDGFLAVAHIDAHRKVRLDEASARLLADRHAECGGAYAYFAELTGIDAAGFRSFFGLVDGAARLPVLEANLAMGQMHSLVEWVVLLRRRQVVDDAEAARLFAAICDRLTAARDEGARTVAAIDLAEAVLAKCPGAGGWDDRLRGCLLGGSAERADRRGRDFQIVLDEQKAPSLDAVRGIVAEARGGGSGRGLVSLAGGLPSVLPGKDTVMSAREKDALALFDPARVQRVAAGWNGGQGAQELLKAMEPQVTLALAAPVYAYFFRSGDLVMSGDGLLLRKHAYVDYVHPGEERRVVCEAEFISGSEGLGSHLQGGFATFGLASGFAVASGWKQGGAGGPAVVAEQVAAIRGATWELLPPADQHLVTLRVLAAREWIVAAAEDAGMFVTLSEETAGLLSLARRADLLNGIEERDWPRVWGAVPLPDLFRLGGSWLARYPAAAHETPVTMQLRAAGDGQRLDILGRVPEHVLGCGHTHLVADAPYEEYERQLLPTYMAERTAEFKLFLAYRADRAGMQPADLAGAAEQLARKAFRVSAMNDDHDWRALLRGFGSISNEDLRNAMEP